MVVTDGFAGVSATSARCPGELDRRGHRVVHHRRRPGTDALGTAWHGSPTGGGAPDGGSGALAATRDVDLVHVHMTAAEGAAWLARPLQRAPVVATRHFAQRTGVEPSRPGSGPVTSRVVSYDIAISQFVAESIGTPSVVIPNGVPDRSQAALEAPTVVMLQRLDAEKASDLGIRAFARSGLAEHGLAAGGGRAGPAPAVLLRLVGELGLTGQRGPRRLGGPTPTSCWPSRRSSWRRPPSSHSACRWSKAMAHGLPVVAAAGGAHLETVGEDGLLFPPGDAGAAADALPGWVRTPAGGTRSDEPSAADSRSALALAPCDRLEWLYRHTGKWPHGPSRRTVPAPGSGRRDPAAGPIEGQLVPGHGSPTRSGRHG